MEPKLGPFSFTVCTISFLLVRTNYDTVVVMFVGAASGFLTIRCLFSAFGWFICIMLLTQEWALDTMYD